MKQVEELITWFTKDKQHDLGIVLGGGGARGFAHLGVLKALEEQGVVPDICAGVSAGAVVGAFWAANQSIEDAYEFLKSRKIISYKKVKWPKHGLLNLNSLGRDIEKKIPFKNIEDLPRPFFIGVSNFTQGHPDYITQGDLATYVLASSSIPVVFPPITIDNELYVDGGLFNNLPVSPLNLICKKVIAVNISPTAPRKNITNILNVATRAFQLSVSANMMHQKIQADILIEPKELSNFDLLDTSHAEEIFDLGYQAVKKLDIKTLLKIA
ncbi:MAG: NTE family protein [Flavobacteriales bacterium]|jgi:NTE family protein